MLARETRLRRSTETADSLGSRKNTIKFYSTIQVVEEDGYNVVAALPKCYRIQLGTRRNIIFLWWLICFILLSHTNAVYTTYASKPEKDCVVAISKPLLMGPEFSSDTSGDGPDKYSDEKEPVIEGSSSGDSESEKNDGRPPTPTKPRGMTKQKYRNMVRSHRNRYPKVTSRDSTEIQLRKQGATCDTKVNEEMMEKKSKASRNRGSRKNEYERRTKRRKELGPEARRKDVEAQKKKREDMSPEARRKHLDSRKKKREEIGPEARRKDVEAQKKKRKDMSPEARRKYLDSRKKKREEMGPEAQRKDVESQKKKRQDMGPEACVRNVEAQNKKRKDM